MLLQQWENKTLVQDSRVWFLFFLSFFFGKTHFDLPPKTLILQSSVLFLQTWIIFQTRMSHLLALAIGQEINTLPLANKSDLYNLVPPATIFSILKDIKIKTNLLIVIMKIPLHILLEHSFVVKWLGGVTEVSCSVAHKECGKNQRTCHSRTEIKYFGRFKGHEKY